MMDAATRAAVLRLLNDVVESEHRLRHRNAFEALCAELGFEPVHEPNGSRVRDPAAEEAARVAAEAAANDANAAPADAAAQGE